MCLVDHIRAVFAVIHNALFAYLVSVCGNMTMESDYEKRFQIHLKARGGPSIHRARHGNDEVVGQTTRFLYSDVRLYGSFLVV